MENYDEARQKYLEYLTKQYNSGDLYRYIANKFSKLRIEDLEDIVSDAFCDMIELNSVDKDLELVKGLLYRKAYNKAIDLTRDRLFNCTDYYGDDFAEVTDLCVSIVVDTVEKQVIDKERVREVRALIDSLPKDHRIIMLMRYGGYKSYKEIGDRLGMKESTVRSLELRIRKKLAVLAKERGVTL